MPPPRPPSSLEPLLFPAFGMSWYADPADGRSILAYCGGGGSARTGVNNAIIVQDCSRDHDFVQRRINTGNLVGYMVQIYSNPVTKRLWMVVALGRQVQRYSLPDATLNGVLEVESIGEYITAMSDGANNVPQPQSGESEGKEQPAERSETVRVNAMADRLALGLMSGRICVYATADEDFLGASGAPLFVCQGSHAKEICDLQFSLQNHLLVSSARDGTARVWDSRNGRPLQTLECDVSDPNAPNNNRPSKKPRRGPTGPGPITVKASAFLDLPGQNLVTLASGRRGRAFLTHWRRDDAGFTVFRRTPLLPVAASSMSLSQCGELLAAGGCDGTVVLWNVPEWKLLQQFLECHELPVTGIAARPYPVPLQGEADDGIAVHARSASGDSTLARLTLQKRAPRAPREWTPREGGGVCYKLSRLLHRLIQWTVLVIVMAPLGRRAVLQCPSPTTTTTTSVLQFRAWTQCVWENVVLAPSTRPGVASPPC